MEEYWKKRLPILCGALGGAMLAGVVPACAGLRLAGGEDCFFLIVALLALAALGLALVWRETRRADWVLAAILPIGAAMLVRALCLDYASGDYNTFLCHWYDYFKTNGGIGAIAGSVGDYN